MRFGSPYTIQPDYDNEVENVFMAEVHKITDKEVEDVKPDKPKKKRGRPSKKEAK